VPLIVAAPGMKAQGNASLRLIEHVDLYPTLADLCGLPIPAGLPGRSFRALLDDPAQPGGKEAALTQVRRGGGMAAEAFKGHSIRTKGIATSSGTAGAGATQLYDHQTDPTNSTTSADDPNHGADVEPVEGPPQERTGWRRPKSRFRAPRTCIARATGSRGEPIPARSASERVFRGIPSLALRAGKTDGAVA